jgi:hypothetical protein
LAGLVMAGRVVDKDTGFKKFFARWRKVVASSRRGGPNVTVGIQGNEAAAQHEGEITNLVLGTIHEFGAPAAGIPSRSFIRSTIDKNRRKYEKMIRDLGIRTLQGKALKQGLFILGETVRADIIRRIQAAEIKQELKPPTEPPALVDTGQLINAISSVVHE